jgi:hypothetical protein
MVEGEQNNRWHLDKRVSVGHLITTVAMVAAVSLWLLRLEGRIDLVELRDAQLFVRIERIDVERKVRDGEIIRRLEGIQSTLAEHERSTRDHTREQNE